MLIREIGPRVRLYRDAETGVAWIQDEKNNVISAHPFIGYFENISPETLVNLHIWGRSDRIVNVNGRFFNTDICDTDDKLMAITAEECRCKACEEKRRLANVLKTTVFGGKE